MNGLTLEMQRSANALRADGISNMEEKMTDTTKRKSKRTAEQKRRSRSIALVTCLVLFVVIAILLSAFSLASQAGVKALIQMGNNFTPVAFAAGTQVEPEKDTDGYWTFTKDTDFKVIQFTDVHIGGGFASQEKDAWAMNAVATMLKVEKPDLVVVSGDIAYPVPFQAGTFNNLNATKIFANMMKNLGVYWTFVFGNHDTEAYSTYSRQDICKYYEEQIANDPVFGEYCLFQRGPSTIDGFGNQIIKVKNTSGMVTQAVVGLDSHSYVDGDILGIAWKYDNLHKNQVDWFCDEMDTITAANVTTYNNLPAEKKAANEVFKQAKASVFIHIPLVEYLDAYTLYLNKNAPGYGIECNADDGNSKVTVNSGIIGEGKQMIYPGVKTDEFFEKGSQHGLQAVYCGHDHYNNISMTYQKQITMEDGSVGMSNPVQLTYGRSIDYLAYPGIWKKRAHRGCNAITINATNGTISSQQQDYYDAKYDEFRIADKSEA